MSDYQPRALILRTAGTNCDRETEFAFRLAGAQTSLLHVNVLREEPGIIAEHHILAIPGGFSYGDDLGAGTVLANELMTKLRAPLDQFIEAGKLVIGICNGFQALVKTGLLPGLERWRQQATLTFNDSHKFEDRWTYLSAPPNRSPLFADGERIYLPVAHAEGKFVVEDQSVLDRIRASKQVVCRYCDPDGQPAGYPWNPNGSMDDIAGLCDPTGRILGMMPHPERHSLPVHDPRWPREGLKDEGDGLRIFRRAVEFARRELAAC
ncbi:MAG: phosphoribosylformylglycinamidine synthase I [Planctomycetes bacterium]|nr:phosphoribosylformylglycinamidine synthase I [Planctomycetota bacterium]